MTGAEDTIAAVATARGRAALAVVRVSGPRAVAIASACFRGNDLASAPSHTVHVGLVEGEDGAAVDQVVATVFRAPRSATGEDVIEFSCHGGDFAPALVLQRLIVGGARMAAPGEFTQRAFLNGKLDLAQAEAVADLIHASSSQAHRVSMAHLRGRYSERLARLRDELLELCAYVELELDFSEEDVAFADAGRLERLLEAAEHLLRDLLGSYRLGELLRDGIMVVIGGRPNAGKSTLFNALVGFDRAIVSEIPGTTRDSVEAEAEIEGLRFRFVDTAGLRDTADVIEAEGVRRTHQAIASGEALLYVYDRTLGLDGGEVDFLEQMHREHPHVPVLLVGNKRDLGAEAFLPEGLSFPVMPVSAIAAGRDMQEMEPLAAWLIEKVAGASGVTDASAVVMNLRHREHLSRAHAAIERANKALRLSVSGDALAVDLRVALHELGSITGEITNEDVLDQIFSRFCIGK